MRQKAEEKFVVRSRTESAVQLFLRICRDRSKISWNGCFCRVIKKFKWLATKSEDCSSKNTQRRVWKEKNKSAKMSAIYCKGLNLIKNPGLINAYRSHSAHQFSDFVCKNASRSLSTIIGGMVCGLSFHNSTHSSNENVYQLFPNQILLIGRRPFSRVKWDHKIWTFIVCPRPQSSDLVIII